MKYILCRPLDSCLTSWEYWVSKNHSSDDRKFATHFETKSAAYAAVGWKQTKEPYQQIPGQWRVRVSELEDQEAA
jgi:hypothetical protein